METCLKFSKIWDVLSLHNVLVIICFFEVLTCNILNLVKLHLKLDIADLLCCIINDLSKTIND